MKYKVNDKVQIKSREWFDAQEKDECGNIKLGNESFVDSMYKYCGKYASIAEVFELNEGSYKLDIDNGTWYWQDWMLE